LKKIKNEIIEDLDRSILQKFSPDYDGTKSEVPTVDESLYCGSAKIWMKHNVSALQAMKDKDKGFDIPRPLEMPK